MVYGPRVSVTLHVTVLIFRIILGVMAVTMGCRLPQCQRLLVSMAIPIKPISTHFPATMVVVEAVHVVVATRTTTVANDRILVMGNCFYQVITIKFVSYSCQSLFSLFRPRSGGRGVISYNDLDDPGNDGF